MMTNKTPLSIRLFTQARMCYLCMAFALPIFLIIGCNDTKSLTPPPEPEEIDKVVTYSYVAQPGIFISERIVFDNSTDVFKFKNPTIIGDFLHLSGDILTAIEGKPFPIGFHSYTLLSEDALITLTIQIDIQFTLDELRIYNYLQEIDSQSLVLPDLTTDSAPLQLLYDSDYSGATFERRFYLRAGDSIRGVFATLNAAETDIAFLVCYTAEDGVVPTSFDLFECNSAITYNLSPYAPQIKTVDLTAIAAPDLVIAKPLLFDSTADAPKFNNPTVINDFLILQDGVITNIDGAPLPIGTNTYTLHANDLSIMVYINLTLTLTPQAQDIFDILKNSTNPSIALSDPTLDLSDQEIQYDSAFTGGYPNARFFFRVDNQMRGITVAVDSAFDKTTLVCYAKQSRAFPGSFAVFDCDSATTHDMGTLCVTGGDFVPTSFAGGSGIAGNGSDLFNNASDADRLACFRKAYLLDILPNPAPNTPQTLINSLPDDLTYAKSQYKLAYHDEFNTPDTVGPYDLNTVLGDEWFVHYGGYWPDDPSDYQYKPWRWPIAIKDGKLNIGNARYSMIDYYAKIHNTNLTCTDNDDGTGTFYNPGDGSTWTVPTCGCTENDWSQKSCLPVIPKMFLKHQYQYGYLEFRLETNTNGAKYLKYPIDFIIGLRQLFSLSTTSVAYQIHKISGTPSFLAKSTLKDELLNYGVEMQFAENKILKTNNISVIDDTPIYSNDSSYPAKVVSWFVFHYGQAKVPGIPKSRFYHSWNHTRPQSRTYGFEWTPRGYRIWFDGVRQNPQTSSEFAKYALGLCNAGKLGGGGANDYIKCGISHTAQPAFNISGGSEFTLLAQNPDYHKIDYIRLYKPINNYSDMNPLYQ